jgi:hypothetical protein
MIIAEGWAQLMNLMLMLRPDDYEVMRLKKSEWKCLKYCTEICKLTCA